MRLYVKSLQFPVDPLGPAMSISSGTHRAQNKPRDCRKRIEAEEAEITTRDGTTLSSRVENGGMRNNSWPTRTTCTLAGTAPFTLLQDCKQAMASTRIQTFRIKGAMRSESWI